MSRYINRDAVIEMLWDLVELENAYDMKKQAVEIVQNWEPSDVVEVVRCKDCLHGSWCEDVLWCNITDEPMTENDFCSKGDRI